MRNVLFAVSVAALCSFPASAQSATSLADDAKAFGSREAVAVPFLSPEGGRVLYLTPGAGTRTVAITANLGTGQSQVVVGSDGNPEKLRWCKFVAVERVVCRLTGEIEQAGNLVGFGRLVAVDSNGGNPNLLGERSSFYDARQRQFDGAVVDWLGGSTGSVLMSREYVPEEGKIGTKIARHKDGLGVDRIDTATLRGKSIEPPRPGTSSYMTDGRGTIRLMTADLTGAGAQLTGKSRYWYRTKGSRDWQELTDSQGELQPLAIDADLDALYTLKKNNGRWALYTIKLDGSLASTFVGGNPRVDIDDVVRIGAGQRVIGYTFAEAARKVVYFDPEFRSLSASLSKALPKLPIVDFIDSSSDGRKLLIFAGSDRDPGRYYVFDRDKKSLDEVMLARPALAGRTLAEVKPVTIPASDGGAIPGYLTLPAGRDPKGLPAIVLPHGGPSARDEWGFDWLAQFLAARGYAVLQPNYRGSAGFGDSWLNENGFRNWRTSIGDISASARWLASQGIADPAKLAIVGWSYGGYAALQSAVTEPSLYKAVVAIAPVTDLNLLKQDAQGFTDRRLTAEFVGSGAHVSEGSPLRKANAIQVPVMLVHGERDSNVRVSHSRKMDSALRAAGKTSDLLTFKGLDHHLEDSSARTEMLTRIGALLERTIGR